MPRTPFSGSRHGWRAALVLSALAALLSSPGASDAVFATPPLLGGVAEAEPELAPTATGTAAVSPPPPPRRSCAETLPFAVDGGATAEVEGAAIAAQAVRRSSAVELSEELSATQRPSRETFWGAGRGEVIKHPRGGCGGNDGAAVAGDGEDGARVGAGCISVGGGGRSAKLSLSRGQERSRGLQSEMSSGDEFESVGAPAAAAASVAAVAGLNGRADSGEVEHPQEATKDVHVPLSGVKVVLGSSADTGRNGEKKGDRDPTRQHQEQQQQQQQQQQPRRRQRRRDAGAAETHPLPEIPASKSGPRGEVLAQYVVQWTDFHPLEDHNSLLSRALGGFDRCCSGGCEASDAHGSSDARARDSVGASSSSTSTWSGREEDERSRRSGDGKDEVRNGGDGGSKDDPSPCGCCWELVERVNPATSSGKFPSDFSLVRLRHQATEASDVDDANLSKIDRTSPQGDNPEQPEHEEEQAQCRVGGGQDGGNQDACPGARVVDPAAGIPGNACEEGRDRGVPCVRAAAEEAVGALRAHRWVKGVFREKALTRGVFAARDVDPPREQLFSSPLGHDGGDIDNGSKKTPHSPSDPNAGTEGQGDRSGPSLHSYKGGEPGEPIGGDAITNSGGEIEANGHITMTAGGTADSKRRWERWPGAEGERGARRQLDGGSALAAAGGEGRLRGSSRGEFVDAGEQGKPLRDHGFTGKGIRVAIFDTGLEAGGHDFDNVVERINWTDEKTLKDTVGHGTHVAGVIGGRDQGCSGFAPDADLYIFRVFSGQQVSYTSWFLDAFNYALFLGVDIINLSIGGPDFKDQPFVDKVRELSANGVVVFSAVGNDGPLYGTQHNPADQMDTIGVGAVSASGRGVASFQSRGMTTWELPGGYGRVKPDLVAVGQFVLGPKAGGPLGQCSGISGTSVASPVVAGAAALLASTVPPDRRRDIVNPASIKQVLTESARRVKEAGVFEQGAGALDVAGAFVLLSRYTPRASLLPPQLDLTDPYMWPFSRQPLYYGAQPVVFNVTVANGMGVTGYITSLSWAEERTFQRAAGRDGDVLDVKAEFSDVLWPWSGFLALSLTVSESGRDFQGLVLGKLEVTVESEAGPGETQPRTTNAILPVTVSVIRTPPRHRRLLWDQFHSVPYPPAYFPRDYLGDDADMLDRLGDHPHTNFRTLFEALLDAGYYVEILGSEWSCFDAESYGALLVVDPEAELGQDEKAKLEMDVKERGLSVVVFADWYSTDVMSKVRFVDDNTRMPWEPVTGGSNVPAINDFLLPAFGMALGGTVFDGVVSLPGGEVHLASGNAVSRMPPGSLLVSASSLRGIALRGGGGYLSPGVLHMDVPVIGAFDTKSGDSPEGTRGRVFLFGDSSCADDVALSRVGGSGSGHANGALEGGSDCLWLFESAVRYACEGFEDPAVFRDAVRVPQDAEGGDDGFELDGFSEGSGKGGGFNDGHPLPERPDTKKHQDWRRDAQEAQGRGLLEVDDADKCSRNRFHRVPTALNH